MFSLVDSSVLVWPTVQAVFLNVHVKETILNYKKYLVFT